MLNKDENSDLIELPKDKFLVLRINKKIVQRQKIFNEVESETYKHLSTLLTKTFIDNISTKITTSLNDGNLLNVCMGLMSFIYDSPYKLKETVDKIQNSAAAYNFRVYPNRALLKGLGKPSIDDKKQIVIRFCNFSNMQEFLKLEPRLGVMLPCRATVLEDE